MATYKIIKNATGETLITGLTYEMATKIMVLHIEMSENLNSADALAFRVEEE